MAVRDLSQLPAKTGCRSAKYAASYLPSLAAADAAAANSAPLPTLHSHDLQVRPQVRSRPGWATRTCSSCSPKLHEYPDGSLCSYLIPRLLPTAHCHSTPSPETARRYQPHAMPQCERARVWWSQNPCQKIHQR